MKTGLLSFGRVCTEYEFAAWELAELVERGEIAATLDGAGGMWFEPDEILRFLRTTLTHFFSFAVASKISGKDENTLRQQAAAGKLKAKKISYVWATNGLALNNYIKQYARNT